MSKINSMKKHILLLTLAITLGTLGMAQLNISGGAGYNFGAKVPVYGGEIKMNGNVTFGGDIEYRAGDEMGISFSYWNTSTNVTVRDYYNGSGSFEPFADVSANYFLINGVKYFAYDQFQPYALAGLGMAYYNFKNWAPDYNKNLKNDYYRFAVGFGLGSKVWFTDRIGINVQIRALAPIQWGGVGIGIGTGGVSSGVYAGSSFLSGDVNGGLVIRLGE